MGMFSWHTTDNKTVIWNKNSLYETKPIYMIDNKGNEWVEHDYEGYGCFGGKDYYELVAEMNGEAEGITESDRLIGIDISFERENSKYIFPNLVCKPNKKWRNVKPRDHMGQGFYRRGYLY